MFQAGRLAATLNPKFQIMNNPNISFGSPGAISYDSPAARGPASLSADEADVAAFNSHMSDTPASTFESRFQNLTPDQKDQVKGALANFTAANDQALESLKNFGPQSSQSEVKSLVSDLNGAVNEGMKFVNTMSGIDPELVKTIPDFGENLIGLMKIVGKTPAEIQQVATAFGIQAP
jgi:hypothetical protein